MILWHTHLSIVRTEFSSSLDYSSSSSGFFDDILLDRSDDSEDIIGVTEERMKGVEKPHTS